MPVTIPPFVQFQGTTFPLRGLWNVRPAEGDKFVNAEIDWGAYGAIDAVQFSLSGNSPVALSQIVSIYVDNRRCGVDVDFLFPDSGFTLTVPQHTQGLFPVLTNALMFYVVALDAQPTDVTILQVLNSMPPPIALIPTTQQNAVGQTAIAIDANSVTPLAPAGVSGTVNNLSIEGNVASAAGGATNLVVVDGTGKNIWAGVFVVPAGGSYPISINLAGLNVRFVNGLNFVVAGAAGITAGSVVDVNVYYTTP